MHVTVITLDHDAVISSLSPLDDGHGIEPGQHPRNRARAGDDDGQRDRQREQPWDRIEEVQTQPLGGVDKGLGADQTTPIHHDADQPGYGNHTANLSSGTQDEPRATAAYRVQNAKLFAALRKENSS